MCGICGIVGERNPDVVQAMLGSIESRGPDFSSVYCTDNHSFAAARLAITKHGADLPWISGDSVVGLLNGEIYNYGALARDLDLRAHPNEIEVIAESLKRYGSQSLAKLNGMFAVAILDGDRLFMARDRYGIKPLFYCQIGKKLVFGSEIKALLRHPEVPAEIDRRALEELSVFGFFLDPQETIFRNIHQVPPGTVLIFDAGRVQLEEFASLPHAYYQNGQKSSFEELSHVTETRLEAAVSSMLDHDAHQKGFYLSGGIDSSLLSVLAAEASAQKVLTFSLADHAESPDLLAAREVASAMDSEHHEFFVNADDLFSELPAYVYSYESLIAGGVFDIYGGLAFHLLSKQVAQHVKVAFSGEGADELFGGYYWIYTHPLGFADRIRERHASIKGNGSLRSAIDRLFPRPENERLYRQGLFDLLMGPGLSNYHLWSVDRSAGAFGFEIRPGYLHDDIAENALALPIDFKANKAQTKIMLKEIARRRLAPYGLSHIADRQKIGMPAAVERISGKFEELARSLITEHPMYKRPFSQYFAKPIEAMMFDLFYATFVVRRGQPLEMSVTEFYKEGVYARMYD